MTTRNQANQSFSLFQRDQILVCGLGSLGQHCVANLKTFGVIVNAIELAPPTRWEILDLPDLIDHLVIGDCRQPDILDAARVHHCRAVLIVTTNERVNLEAALSARVLNPKIRLVVRSEKQNLNGLLEQQLKNFIAFEPTQLAAPAFALEALGDEMIGFFKVDRYQFHVVKRTMHSKHHWCEARKIHEINTRDRQVLRYLKANHQSLDTEDPARFLEHPYSPSTQFYTWRPDATIHSGDVIVTVEAELEDTVAVVSPYGPRHHQRPWQSVKHALIHWRKWNLATAIADFWRSSYDHQIRRVALLCGITVVGLCLTGSVLMALTGVAPTLADAFYVTVVLLLGGYGDLFSDFTVAIPIPWWLRFFSLCLTLAGTAFIGVLYALLTEKLLTLKFEFLAKRPPVPDKGHVVVIWLGRVGRRIVQLLHDLKQPVVGITSQTIDSDVLPQMPLITGRISDALESAHLETAKSIVAVSDDEIQNLELGLMAYRVNPHSRLIIRTYDQLFTDKVAQLFPDAQVLCASALSAEAFAGAAFGENVIGLFRLYHQTVLVTQYDIEAEDTLHDLLLAEIAYGYGVVPIWHQAEGRMPRVMPSNDIKLHPGDRLVVLSTIRGLRRIEQGDLAPKQWHVQIIQAKAPDAVFEGGAEIARVTGCDIGQARTVMNQLPGVLPQRLYLHQALRLVRRLSRVRVEAELLPLEDRVGKRA